MGQLWLGEANVDGAGLLVGQSEAAVAIALMHHPIDWLAEKERAAVENYLDRSFDIVLRGHLHKDRVRAEVSGRGGFLNVAAPAAYQGSRWPNGCFVGEIDASRRSVRLCPYGFGSGADPWTVDPKVFPSDKDHRHTFKLLPKAARETAFIEKLAPALEQLLLNLDQSQREQILRDLDAAPGTGAPDRRVREAVAAARRQGRLAELWDAILAVPGTGGVSALVDALATQLPEIARTGPGAEVRDSLAAFGDFWRAHGQRYQTLLRHARIAPELLFLAYLRHLYRGYACATTGEIGTMLGVLLSLDPAGDAPAKEWKFVLQRAEPSAADWPALLAGLFHHVPQTALVTFSPQQVPQRAELSEVTTSGGEQVWSLRLQL